MANAPSPWLTLVGIGEDGPDGLSPRAVRELARATTVFGGRRHLELAAPLLRGDRMPWRSPIEDSFPHLLSRRGSPTCVLATGDPFHFGIGVTLARLIPADEMLSLPQTSAFSLAAARLGWGLQDCLCLSLHGRALERIVPHLQPGARLLALSWDRSTPGKLAALLNDRGFGPTRLTVCEAMGGPRERLRRCSAAAFDLSEVDDLNTVALEIEVEPGARLRSSAPGLPDDWFEHDGQITKAPIRAVTISALGPRPGEFLWDVGAGSGSVSVEWLLAAPGTTALAIDDKPERLDRVGRNARQWGVGERLERVRGRAPEALVGQPRPDAVFIGGGLTEPGLLDVCRAALRSGGRLVANAVTLESQAQLAGYLTAHGGTLMTLAVSTAEPVGGFHGLRPAMAVMQWRWTKP